jgi:hypothetical protein
LEGTAFSTVSLQGFDIQISEEEVIYTTKNLRSGISAWAGTLVLKHFGLGRYILGVVVATGTSW